MAKKYNMNKIYVVGIVLFIVIVLISIISNQNKNKEDIDDNNQSILQKQKEVEKEKNENIVKKLENMEERDRMEYYFGTFLEYIESGNYENAYDMLYSEFKNNYFPTLNSFEEYANSIFSEMSTIEHENIERNGEVYVLWIKITDAINGKKGNSKEMNIVIKENDYNDVEISFSVI